MVHPQQQATMGQHHREVLAGAAGRVQHPTGRWEPGQEPLHEDLVSGLDLAPLGVVVVGQGVLLSLVDPPAVPEPGPSVSGRRGAGRSVAHVLVHLLRWRLLFLSVLHLRANRLQRGGTWEGGQLPTLPSFVLR